MSIFIQNEHLAIFQIIGVINLAVPVYKCVLSQLLVASRAFFFFLFFFVYLLKVTFQGLYIPGCVKQLSLTYFGIKTITLARFPLHKILEKPLRAECCILYFPFSLKCKHQYHDNEFCSDFGKCDNRCYYLFMDKVDCENMQRLY